MGFPELVSRAREKGKPGNSRDLKGREVPERAPSERVWPPNPLPGRKEEVVGPGILSLTILQGKIYEKGGNETQGSHHWAGPPHLGAQKEYLWDMTERRS